MAKFEEKYNLIMGKDEEKLFRALTEFDKNNKGELFFDGSFYKSYSNILEVAVVKKEIVNKNYRLSLHIFNSLNQYVDYMNENKDKIISKFKINSNRDNMIIPVIFKLKGE